MSYNGYKNYETWAVSMWIDNEEAYYDAALQMALAYGTEDTYDLAANIKVLVEDMPEIAAVQEQASLAADLLGAALSEVDWYELAENWLQVAKEAQEYEEAGR